jgi:hypothetical protein
VVVVVVVVVVVEETCSKGRERDWGRKVGLGWSYVRGRGQ